MGYFRVNRRGGASIWSPSRKCTAEKRDPLVKSLVINVSQGPGSWKAHCHWCYLIILLLLLFPSRRGKSSRRRRRRPQLFLREETPRKPSHRLRQPFNRRSAKAAGLDWAAPGRTLRSPRDCEPRPSTPLLKSCLPKGERTPGEGQGVNGAQSRKIKIQFSGPEIRNRFLPLQVSKQQRGGRPRPLYSEVSPFRGLLSLGRSNPTSQKFYQTLPKPSGIWANPALARKPQETPSSPSSQVLCLAPAN